MNDTLKTVHLRSFLREKTIYSVLLLQIQKFTRKLKLSETATADFINYCLTMGKGRKFSKEDQYAPFTYGKDDWNDDNDSKITVKIEPAKKGTNVNNRHS